MNFIISALFIASVSTLTASNSIRHANVYSLIVEVKGLRSSDGVIQFALYNKNGSIPDEHFKKYCRLAKAKITSGSARITFQDLPEGRYAVNIVHDENSNGKLDKGLFLPKEGIGFSNYASIGLANRPSFEKASFVLNADSSIAVKIIYM